MECLIERLLVYLFVIFLIFTKSQSIFINACAFSYPKLFRNIRPEVFLKVGNPGKHPYWVLLLVKCTPPDVLFLEFSKIFRALTYTSAS